MADKTHIDFPAMPRHTKDESLSFYNTQYSSQYHSDSSLTSPSPPASHPSPPQQQSPPPTGSASGKKKHICSTCERAFTTSGHLARHIRVHTGERNHKCPFPGCETRCSRQDNLQQHYRIHLSPGSRRSSTSATRAAIARAMSGPYNKTYRSSSDMLSSRHPSPHSASSSPPPALEHAIPPTPDSPPALVQAYALPIASTQLTSRSPSPLENGYPTISAHHQDHSQVLPVSSHAMHLGAQSSQMQSHYRNNSPPYSEASHTPSYNYIQASSLSHPNGQSGAVMTESYSYSNSYDDRHLHSSSSIHHDDHIAPSSRLSISHLSHPHTFSNQYANGGPPSPDSAASSQSHTSGPTTPSSAPYRDDHHDAYQNSYSTSYDDRHLPSFSYMSHSHMPNSYYQSPLPLGQTTWRPDNGLRAKSFA